jgi:hypothetical protein
MGGVAVDWCLAWGADCGQPAADRFCREQGSPEATDFAIAEDLGHTVIQSTGQHCDDPRCDGFAYIECRAAPDLVTGRRQPAALEPPPAGAAGGNAAGPSAGGPLIGPSADLAFAVTDATTLTWSVKSGTETNVYRPNLLTTHLVWSAPNAEQFVWRWQIARQPFPEAWSAPVQGLAADQAVSTTATAQWVTGGTFEIDLGKFPPLGQGPTRTRVTGGVRAAMPPDGRAIPEVPIDFYIRLVPTKDGQVAGPPSNVVVAHYLPGPDPNQEVISQAFENASPPFFDVLDIKVEMPPAPNPELASCVRIVSETPPFPRGIGALGVYVNPDGSTVRIGGAGTKITGTLPYTLQDGMALYPFTACPGERADFQWGSVGCGSNPFCSAGEFMTGVTEAAVDAGEFLVDLANGAAEAYNELKTWAIDQVATAVCPSSAAAECKTMINVGVDILLTSVGVPPTMPSFGDLANLAKGELVDLALDELGVGAACDAVAAGTGKSCGQLAMSLKDLNACALAPQGQEGTCQEVLTEAVAVCQSAADSQQCKLLTTNAQDLVRAGFSEAIEQSIAAIEERVTETSMKALGVWFPTQDHYCHWGGPNQDQVICPPDTYSTVKGTQWQPPASVPGCHLVTGIGPDAGKVVCSFPPRKYVATPEPFGQRQPIKVQVMLARNQKPLPPYCESISAVVTTETPNGIVGEPYPPATAPIVVLPFQESPNIHMATLRFNDPAPNAESLLVPGSAVSVKASGACISETHRAIGVIPPPKPRIMPGIP